MFCQISFIYRKSFKALLFNFIRFEIRTKNCIFGQFIREKNMVSQITQGIKVSVFTDFEGSYFKNHRIHYAFSYRVTIENQSKDTVQLLFRHWDIFDALSETEAIDGEGVVGNKPILKSGESHTYTSGCLLTSPFGAMKGFYTMVNFTTTRKFKVSIPTFRLGAVFALN